MKIRNYLIPVFSVLALASCNYEQINTNIYGVTEEGMKTGGLLYGAPFMDMQKLVIPIGSPTESTGPGNDLANTDIMSAGNYIGYWGMNNNWNFNTEATWNFTDARMSYAYQNFYSKLFRAWNDIYKHTKDSEDLPIRKCGLWPILSRLLPGSARRMCLVRLYIPTPATEILHRNWIRRRPCTKRCWPT